MTQVGGQPAAVLFLAEGEAHLDKQRRTYTNQELDEAGRRDTRRTNIALPGTHPINLAVRFLLEIAGLAALAWMGWQHGERTYKYIGVIGLPLLAAILWGVFAVPGDPSRSGNAPVATPGILRLVLELGFFGAATWSLFMVGAANFGWIYAATVLAHYAFSYDRVLWLLRQ